MKHILLIDDEYKQLQTIFTRIAELVLLHEYEKQDDAGMDSYKITWIRILYNEKDYVSDGRVKFEVLHEIEKLKENLSKEWNGLDWPIIEFQSVPIIINSETYSSEVKQIATTVQKSIDRVVNGDTVFALLLDVILNIRNDIVQLIEGKKSILSTELWSKNFEHAIPYSNFSSANNEAKFREKWIEKTNAITIFDKNELVDENYNTDFVKILYSKLGFDT